MGADKLVDSVKLNNDLTSIANAIRIKGGTSSPLVFPTDFVSAIQSISTGYLPTGTKQIEINQNGTITEDVTDYASAQITVNVSGGANTIRIVSENLYDASDIVANTYINGSTETSYNGWSSTDYIEVKPDTYYQVIHGPGNNYNAFYKSDKTSAKSSISIPNSSNDGVILIKTTSDTAYIRMSGPSSGVSNYEIYEVSIETVIIGENRTRQSFYRKFYPAETYTNQNKLSLQLEVANNCYILVRAVQYPTPDSTQYKALVWGHNVSYFNDSYTNTNTIHAILRPNGTIGTDGGTCSYNRQTGILLLGGEYGHFLPEDEYEVIQVVFE